MSSETREVIVGTRGSELAMAQARQVVELLDAAWPQHAFTVRAVKTSGDRFPDASIPAIGTGVFTRDIERGLLNRTLDIAVHSLKDLPIQQPEGLVIAAVLAREDPRDALVSRTGTGLSGLRQGARIGTGSIRRAAQLRAHRPDFEIVSMRGNVPTRLKKLESMELDAIVLAAAGLKRLGLQDRVTEILDAQIMLPAAGQGIVAVETRAMDGEILETVGPLEDDTARIEALTERQLLELLGGGCRAPIGALARAADGRVELSAVVVSPEGAPVVKAKARGSLEDWRDVTWQVAQELKAGGAAEILEQARGGKR